MLVVGFPDRALRDEYAETKAVRDGEDQRTRHVARHDPARVLAECEAKRRIVEEHADEHKWCGGEVYLEPGAVCLTLELLALPYADHQDYRQEWKP